MRDHRAQDQLDFHLTGRVAGEGMATIAGLGLRPALLARYGDPAALRHDFPIVLSLPGADAPLRSLSELFDELVSGLDPEPGARRRAHHARRLERTLRALVAGGGTGTLSALWEAATRVLTAQGDDELVADLRHLRARLADGEVVAFDRRLPTRLVMHVWHDAQQAKVAALRATIEGLARGLSEIVAAAEEHSGAAMTASRLRAALGPGFAPEFDCDAMSGLLTRTLATPGLSDARRARIGRVRETLASAAALELRVDDWVFRTPTAALAAYRERLPHMVDLAKALAVAALEIEGAYREHEHDAVFAALEAPDLEPELAAFPDMLVCLDAERLAPAEGAALMDVFARGVPIKVLLQADDAAACLPVVDLAALAGTNLRQWSATAIAAGGVFVLQCTASHLYRCREALGRGMRCGGPALVAVYSGGSGGDAVPPYLLAAAAVESRALPTVAYDPLAHRDGAPRVSLEHNPQPEADWSVGQLDCEDEALQRAAVELPFTAVEFLACHERHAQHFARVPREAWNEHMIPLHQSIADEQESLDAHVPYLLMVDRDDVVHRVIVDRRLIRTARRCRDQWHSLRGQGEPGRAAAPAAAAPPVAPPPPTVEPAPAPKAEAAPTAGSDEPWIETARCSSCNECIKINPRMFQYDRNKQAYIADLRAGTYADLVQAAESCQVAVIHPGNPAHPDEPGLAEWVERAKPFQRGRAG